MKLGKPGSKGMMLSRNVICSVERAISTLERFDIREKVLNFAAADDGEDVGVLCIRYAMATGRLGKTIVFSGKIGTYRP
jgi:hypothetical protein